MSNRPGSRFSPAPRRRFILPTVLLVVLAVSGLGWLFLRPADEGIRPDRLVSASEIVPPVPLPPLVPGLLHAGDARRTPEGWWILDRRSALVHLLDDDLRIATTFGGRGDGPGEFQMPAALGFRGDSVVVLDAGGAAVLHLFGPDGAFVRKESVHVIGCDTFLATGILDGTMAPVHLLGTCSRLFPTPASGSVLVRVEEGGIGHVTGGEARFRARGLVGAETAVGAGVGEEIWVGDSSSPCLDRIGPPADPGGPASVCLAEWVAVRFSLAELAVRMGRSPGDARLAAVLGPMEWLPVMDRVFPHPDGLVLRRLSGLTVRDLVHLRPDGSTAVLWSGLPEASWVGGEQVLVAWDGVEGLHLELRALHADPDAQARVSTR
ncbi:hypothetical protein BH23GEM11_BH23GEM11_17790 [soil metagenome]